MSITREEARKLVKSRNFNRDVFDHILDAVETIEARLEDLGSCGIVEITPSNKGDFDIDYNKVSEGMDITWPQTEKEIKELAKQFNEHETQKREYVTMAEHIANRPEGMTAEEARQDFVERALANIDKLESYEISPETFCKWPTNYIPRFVDGNECYRLPLDANGELPDYPLLRCPDVDGRAIVQVNAMGNYQYMCGPFRWTRHRTHDAAKAMANKIMRERFGVAYG